MSAVERVACPHLVGRLEHLEWLQGALATVGQGTSCVVLLGGEAGVGKTRLVEEFASRAGLGGAHVLTGGCVDLGEVSLPYAPIVEALRGLAREHGGPGGFLERLGAAESAADRAELARLLPELGVATPATAAPGDGTQARLFDVILRLLEALTASGSVALILEDLHWADQSTLDLVAFLTRNAHHARVLLLGTYRSDELHRRHPLRPVLAELDRSGRVDRRVLPRFNLDEVTDQLTGILGQAPESALADDIFDRSEGNPFFVEELAAAGRGGSGPLPPTLRDILMARLERLPEDAQHVLRVAAAAGPRVDHRLLVSVAGLPVATLLEALRAAVTNHVLSPDDLGEAYTFRHALLQEALYAELLPGERTTLHTAFAETIQERPELAATNPAAALAYHWYRALDPPRALASAVEAGRHDERVYAFPEAQTHFERALELWSKVPEPERLAGMDEVELLRRAAEAAYLAGHLDRALALATRALALIPDHEQDPLRAGLLYERLGRYRWIGGRGRDLDAFERALALVPPEPSAERARVLAAYGGALMLNDQHAASRSVCEEAIQVARQVGARQAESSALNSLGVTLAEGFGELDTGVAHLQQSRHIAEEIGSVEDISRAWCNLASVLVTGGRLEDGLGVALEGVKVSERVGLGRTEGIKHLSHAGEVLIDLGRWDDAERLLADGQPMTPGASWAAGHAQLEHARLLYLRGAFDNASRELAGVRRRPAWPNGWSGDYLLQLTAELACWQDRPEDARAALVEARSRGRHCACDHWSQLDVWMRAEADLAVRARTRRDDEGLRAARSNAEELLEQVRSLRQQALGSPAQQFEGISLNAAAEMTRLHGQPDPAAWDRAATHWESLEHVPRALYARWRQAEALLATRAPRGEIEAVLRPAAATARQLGAVPLTERLEAVARRARITLSAGATDGAAAAPAGLTRREIEVLGLVADGRSNRQIGEALFISEKTASVHVSNILAKLSVASRLEAAAAAHRLGLLDTPTS